MPESPKAPLTKLCRGCGLSKPLSAFLQLTDSGQPVYGSFCSTCRKAGKNKPLLGPAEEGSSTSETGHRIDAKTKVKTEINQKESLEITKIREHEERADIEIEKGQHLDKKLNIAKKEREHREDYLKQGSFLDNRRKPASTEAYKQFFQDQQIKSEVDSKNAILTHDSSQIKFQSAVFRQFKSWLGASAPIVENIEKLGLDKENQPNKPGSKKR